MSGVGMILYRSDKIDITDDLLKIIGKEKPSEIKGTEAKPADAKKPEGKAPEAKAPAKE
jgi:hypothetical protein